MGVRFVRLDRDSHPAWRDLQHLSDIHYHSDFHHRGPTLVSQKNIFWVVAYANDRPVGYVECGIHAWNHPRDIIIFSYYTRPSARKKGVAVALTQYVASYARAKGILRVRGLVNTAKAVKILESFRRKPRMWYSKEGVRSAESITIDPVSRESVIRVRPARRGRRKAA